jgi:hypothetical protein
VLRPGGVVGPEELVGPVDKVQAARHGAILLWTLDPLGADPHG